MPLPLNTAVILGGFFAFRKSAGSTLNNRSERWSLM